jgi:hypothetical protein
MNLHSMGRVRRKLTHPFNSSSGGSQTQRMCAGRECQKQGIHCLGVRYLNRLGWFCDSCMKRLLADDLVYQPNYRTEITPYHVNELRNQQRRQHCNWKFNWEK